MSKIESGSLLICSQVTRPYEWIFDLKSLSTVLTGYERLTALELWVEELESGKYKQTQSTLKGLDGGYCCLGVISEMAVSCNVGYWDSQRRYCFKSLLDRPRIDNIWLSVPLHRRMNVSPNGRLSTFNPADDYWEGAETGVVWRFYYSDGSMMPSVENLSYNTLSTINDSDFLTSDTFEYVIMALKAHITEPMKSQHKIITNEVNPENLSTEFEMDEDGGVNSTNV